MGADKRWGVGRTTDGGPVLEYGYLPLGVGFGMLNAFGPDEATAAYAALVDAVHSQDRLRAIEAIVAEWDQRGATWCMNRIAAILRGES